MKAPTTLAKLLLIAVVTGAATTGCATGGTLSSGAVADRQTAVRILNYNLGDVRIYLVPASGGTLVRLGRTITSMTTLQIPLRGPVATELRLHGSLRFLIRPLDNPRQSYTTRSVIMTPGDVMSLTVASKLLLSTLEVESWQSVHRRIQP